MIRGEKEHAWTRGRWDAWRGKGGGTEVKPQDECAK